MIPKRGRWLVTTLCNHLAKMASQIVSRLWGELGKALADPVLEDDSRFFSWLRGSHPLLVHKAENKIIQAFAGTGGAVRAETKSDCELGAKGANVATVADGAAAGMALAAGTAVELELADGPARQHNNHTSLTM